MDIEANLRGEWYDGPQEDELRHAAELLETFIASASPRVIRPSVIAAAKAELGDIYNSLAAYDCIPF